MVLLDCIVQAEAFLFWSMLSVTRSAWLGKQHDLRIWQVMMSLQFVWQDYQRLPWMVKRKLRAKAAAYVVLVVSVLWFKVVDAFR